MNWDQIQGQWKILAGKAKEKWGQLTDDEIEATSGRADQLEGLLQKKLGCAKEEAQRQVAEFQKSCNC